MEEGDKNKGREKRDEKVTPLFERKWKDDPDIAKYKLEIEKVTFEKAMDVCWVSKDAKGHSVTLSCRIPPGLSRYLHVMKSASPRFKTMSDFLRTAIVLGAKQLADKLEFDEKIGNALDNFFRHLQLQNVLLKVETVRKASSEFASRMKKALKDCSSPKEFKMVYEDFKEQAEGCGDELLQEKMFEALKEIEDKATK